MEGNGKTMIGAAGLVGSEGERGSSMLAITGQAAGAGPLAPGQRWSLARKYEVVLRLLRGEPVEAVSRQLGVPVWQLEGWRARALAGLKTGDNVMTAGGILGKVKEIKESKEKNEWRVTVETDDGRALATLSFRVEADAETGERQWVMEEG